MFKLVDIMFSEETALRDDMSFYRLYNIRILVLTCVGPDLYNAETLFW